MLAEHDRVRLLVVTDGDDDERGSLADIRRRSNDFGARGARGIALLLVEVAGGDRMAVPEQVPGHRQSHPPDADDADLLARCVCHGSP